MSFGLSPLDTLIHYSSPGEVGLANQHKDTLRAAEQHPQQLDHTRPAYAFLFSFVEIIKDFALLGPFAFSSYWIN